MSRNFKKIEDLNFVVKILNEINITLQNSDRTYKNFEDSEFAELLLGISSGGVAIGGSILAISSMGAVAGLSAAGITSGLAAIGGTMLGGLAMVAAAPIAIGGLAYYGGKKYKESVVLSKAVKDTYITAVDLKEKLNLELNNEVLKSKERLETLKSEEVLLNKCIENLQSDLKLDGIL